MNLQGRPIVLQYDYGFGRWSLPGTLGSWIGSLPIDFISFNLKTISREPHKGEVDGPSFLSFPVTLGRAFMAKPSMKAFLNPSSLEFIFPTKGFVPVISPVPRLSPLSLRASSLRSSVRPYRACSQTRPPPLPCYLTAKGTSPIPRPFPLPLYPYPFRHLPRGLEEENILASVQMPHSLQKKSGERRLWGEGRGRGHLYTG